MTLRERIGRTLTFWFFFTVPGMVMATIIGAAMWATLPIWVAVTIAILVVDRIRGRR
jgi:hypothetical protein